VTGYVSPNEDVIGICRIDRNPPIGAGRDWARRPGTHGAEEAVLPATRVQFLPPSVDL